MSLPWIKIWRRENSTHGVTKMKIQSFYGPKKNLKILDIRKYNNLKIK